mmetsp:Transcript_10777/g.26696  ORF Transcript_10777/g.26696 Transcript_10777/m.26696 type:complete len:89 (-) Transcript_10777:378-644(-)|eukprot:CAMPEP_0173436008 /NCGR_PEP_ID=MMETSP1357-20121228/15708_1 /TAXON_ID=77926 /ORGANISM="Hemiselmis rufescens, Strain PCC563" /LENGTH=88 /DNA_ID=CAMNT_0014401053 /DNA_START=245 /DNA_END=511 /DNA_ORIENTATION=+
MVQTAADAMLVCSSASPTSAPLASPDAGLIKPRRAKAHKKARAPGSQGGRAHRGSSSREGASERWERDFDEAEDCFGLSELAFHIEMV